MLRLFGLNNAVFEEKPFEIRIFSSKLPLFEETA